MAAIRNQTARRFFHRIQIIELEDRSLPSFLGPISYEIGSAAGSVAAGVFTSREFSGCAS